MENLKMLPTTGYTTEQAVKEFRDHAEQNGLRIARISKDSTSYFCRYDKVEDKEPHLSIAS